MVSSLILYEETISETPQLPLWYATSTVPRHEKAIAKQLDVRSVEHFLPLYCEIRYWKERRAQVELPLFPGYVFVRMPIQSRLRVLEVPGVLNIVSFSGKPAALPDAEIEALKTALALRNYLPHPYLTHGTRVRIKAGPLRGLEGVIDRQKSEYRMIVSVDFIQRSMSIELSAADLDCL